MPDLLGSVHHVKITSLFLSPAPPLRSGCAGRSQRSSAQALSEITAKVLRTINATEKAACELLYGESQSNGGRVLPAGHPPSLADGKEVAEAYRELEANVRF